MYPVHALVVEDSAADADMLARLMQRAQLVRFGAKRVAWLNSALTLLDNTAFDVVLVDMGLPDSQGIDTVVEIIGHARETPVVVLTGHADVEMALKALRAGAQSYLVKDSVTTRDLEFEVLSAIERKKSEAAAKRLMHASVRRLREGQIHSTPPPAEGLVSGHVAAVEASVAEARAYLLRNAPQHFEAVDRILEAGGLDVAVREMRALLRMDMDAGQKTLTDIAVDALRASADPEFDGSRGAERGLLEVQDSLEERAGRLAAK